MQPETCRELGGAGSSSSLALLIVPLNKRDEASKSKTRQGKGEQVWFSIAAAVGTAGGSSSAPREPHGFRVRCR